MSVLLRSATPVALAAAALVFAGGVSSAASAGKAPASIAKIAKRIAVPGHGAVASGAGAVWATDGSGTLYRIDPRANRIVARLALGTRSPQLCCAFGFGAMWISDVAANTLIRVDLATNRVAARIAVGRNPVGVAVGFGSVWVANNGGASVARVEPRTNTVTATISVGRSGREGAYGNGPLSIAVADGDVWATVPNDGTVVRIDPQANRVVATVSVPKQCVVTASGARVWVASACGAPVISRIDTKTNRVAARANLRDVPGPPAVLGAHLWSVTFSGKLVRMNAQSLKLVGRMPLPGLNVEGESLTTARGAVWVRAAGWVVRLHPR